MRAFVLKLALLLVAVSSLAGIVHTYSLLPLDFTCSVCLTSWSHHFFHFFADSYDPLDPNGNITVTFDTHKWTDDGYVVSVTNFNLVELYADLHVFDIQHQ